MAPVQIELQNSDHTCTKSSRWPASCVGAKTWESPNVAMAAMMSETSPDEADSTWTLKSRKTNSLEKCNAYLAAASENLSRVSAGELGRQ